MEIKVLRFYILYNRRFITAEAPLICGMRIDVFYQMEGSTVNTNNDIPFLGVTGSRKFNFFSLTFINIFY